MGPAVDTSGNRITIRHTLEGAVRLQWGQRLIPLETWKSVSRLEECEEVASMGPAVDTAGNINLALIIALPSVGSRKRFNGASG